MDCRRIVWFVVLPLIALMVDGCAPSSIDRAPPGFAVVREHIIYAPRNDPPISSTLDFTITEVDGAKVVRETLPPLVDMQPGALVSVGRHQFKALEAPHIRPRDYQLKEVSFVATAESGKVYYLVDRDRLPVLIEAHPKSQ